jgi:hypothetical protein
LVPLFTALSNIAVQEVLSRLLTRQSDRRP